MTLTAHYTLHGLPLEIAASADADGMTEIEIIPTGAVALNDGRGAFKLDDPAGFVARTMAHANAHTGGKILIDFDHSAERKGDAKNTAAAGWIEGLRHEAAASRIMATVRWTRAGREALADRSYRFISPVFAQAKDRSILGMVRAGLTNHPAISGMEPVAASAQHEETDMSNLAGIAKALGLAEDAPEADIIAAASQAHGEVETARAVLVAAGVTGDLDDAAIDTLKGKLQAASAGAGDPDPAKYVPRAERDELAGRVAKLEAAAVTSRADDLVAAAVEDGKVTPAGVASVRKWAESDPDGFTEWAKTAPVVCASGELIPSLKPKAAGDGVLSETEKQVCAAMGQSEADFIANRDGKPLAKKEA